MNPAIPGMALTALPNALSMGASVLRSVGQGLQELKNHQKNLQAEKAATGFESVFISMMLKEMRQTQSGEGLFAGDKSDTFGGMFDMMMGQHMADAGGIGLSRFLTSAGIGQAGADDAELVRSGNSVSAAIAAYQTSNR
ncbi:MAG: rod-binding protein [Planctomycetaceae bacterium]|nr:rod-binding protein [Planctomycetaceae bacterium]MCA9916235.1 rod-binding protein [Anaerolineae bacterium]